jgi:predicted nuclease of predicted toxin-antitoxin system
MKFLLDANLPRSAAKLLRQFGHEVQDARNLFSDGTDDQTIAAFAKINQLILLTRDFDFADIRNYPPENYSGLVVLQLPDDATATQVNQTLESFLSKPQFLEKLSGRLAIVEFWRVRFRPA